MNLVDSQNVRTVGITGGGGFIGRAVVSGLQSAGLTVILLAGDVRDSGTFDKDFDVLIHLAALTPSAGNVMSAEMVSVNVAGSTQALEACRQRGAPIVLASTSGIYQSQSSREPLVETSPIQPRWLYPLTKHMAEQVCLHYAHTHGVRGTILRIFNVYGPGQSDFFLIAYLIASALSGKRATIRNRYSIRDWVHVDDVASAFVKAATHNGDMLQLNVGAGIATDMIQLTDAIGKAVGGDPVSYDLQDCQNDPTPVVYADINAVRQALDWQPQISFADGIADCFEQARLAGGQ